MFGAVPQLLLLRLPGTPSVEHLPLTDPTKLRFGRLVAMSRALRVLAGLAAPLGAVATGSQAMATSSSRANPIRRVVSNVGGGDLAPGDTLRDDLSRVLEQSRP